MLCAGWGIASWAFSSQISHTVHLYANRTAVVQPQYQQKPLWYSRQTFVSVLCCQHRDNEAAGTNPATPRLSCSPKTPLITTSCKVSHLEKRLSPPITSTSIASLITLIWGQHGLLVYSHAATVPILRSQVGYNGASLLYNNYFCLLPERWES